MTSLDLSTLGMLQRDFFAVFPNPAEPAMLLIGEECRRSLLSQSGCHCEATDATTDYYNVLNILIVHFSTVLPISELDLIPEKSQ